MKTGSEWVAEVRGALESLRDGRVRWSELGAKLGSAPQMVDEIFSNMISELDRLPVDMPGAFVEEVKKHRAEKIATLRTLAGRWRGTLDRVLHAAPTAVELEGTLAQLIESERALLQFAEQLRGEARLPLSSLNLGGDFFGTLAEKLAQKKIDRDTYLSLLGAYARETDQLIELGRTTFFAAVEVMRQFDGSNFPILQQAAELLRAASNTWNGARHNAQEK